MSASSSPPRVSIAVGSGKGGVGKSTVSVNLALALAERGPTGLLDADVYGPNIPLMFNLARHRPAEYWTLARAGGMRIAPVERHGIKLASAGFIAAEEQPLVWDAGLVDVLLSQLVNDVVWGDLSFLVVDLPPGTSTIPQAVIGRLDLSGAIVVVTPQDVAHLDARRAVTMFRDKEVKVLGGVENMSGMTCPHCGEVVEVFHPVREDRSVWSLGVERLCRIPIDPELSRAVDSGHPLMVVAPQTTAAQAFRTLAGRVVKALAADQA